MDRQKEIQRDTWANTTALERRDSQKNKQKDRKIDSKADRQNLGHKG